MISAIRIFVALVVVPTCLAGQGTFAFTDVSVIPMDREQVLEHRTVVVTDGRIAGIAAADRVDIPRNAVVIDGRGKFLIPGLGDAHAHLSTQGGGTALADRALTLFALNGVTMVRSMYTEAHHRASADKIERGELVGPRTMLVSPPIMGQNAPTPGAARDAVRAHHAAGYRVIKILPGLSRETFDTLAAEARRLSLPLAGHVPADVGLERSLASGFMSIEHLDGFLEALVPPSSAATPSGFFGLGVLSSIDTTRLPRLVAATKAAGVTIVPTEFEMELFVTTDSGETLARSPEAQYAPKALVDVWTRQKTNFARGAGVTPERQARYRDARRQIIRALHAAGVPIAVGSDAFNMFDVPGFGTFHELETLVASGLSPFAAITASTTVVSRLMGIDKDVGTIAPGKAADLVLLDGNPLSDIRNVRRQAGVMLRGQWLPRSALDEKLRALAAP